MVYVPFRAAMINVHEPTPLVDAVAGLPRLLVDALRILALPFDLSIERKVHTGVVVGWVALAVAAGVVVWSWRRTGSRLPLSGFCWFVVLLGPSSIVVQRTGIVADRYLYAPMFGIGIALTALIAKQAIPPRPVIRHALLAAATAWAAITLVVAWRQVSVWRDRSTLYRHALAMEPTSSGATYRVAVLEIQDDHWDRAVPLLERAIELDAHNVQALNNLGVYYMRQGRAADAEQLLQRAVATNPAHFRAWTNLGLAQLANREHDAGCRSITRALSINPSYAPAAQARAQACNP
jgi:hypothetical protein